MIKIWLGGDICDFLESGTEKHFATARLTRVVEKKMGDLTSQDKEGHEEFKNNAEMYKTYRGYYRKLVDPLTVVKIIWFELLERI